MSKSRGLRPLSVRFRPFGLQSPVIGKEYKSRNRRHHLAKQRITQRIADTRELSEKLERMVE